MKLFEIRYLSRIDFRALFVVICIMAISLIVMSESQSLNNIEELINEPFWTPLALSQLKWFCLGLIVYFLASSFDYNKLREWAWFLYIIMIIALIGLFFTPQTHNVQRWYRIPGLCYIQPSELSKLICVIVLSWYLEKQRSSADCLKTALTAGIIVCVPFFLILLQPDLGSALVLYPVTLAMFYFADVYKPILKMMIIAGTFGAVIFSGVLMGVIPYEGFKPVATTFMKEYQYQRLDPTNYHHKASALAIAMGGVSGQGWRKGDFTSGGWLPAPLTDSVFPNFGEHYGFLGLVFLLIIFYILLYLSFKVSTVAKDHFGQLLSTGVAVYLAMHILINIGMMCGLLPITGVPLILVTYGGSSSIVTMAALGVLQSIYSRRFMF